MVAFEDAIPSLRIAVDLKVELFRNPAKPWSMNAILDIDALSMAMPYCHVVVPDSEMADLLPLSGAGPRHGTKVITRLSDLPCPRGCSVVARAHAVNLTSRSRSRIRDFGPSA
jgi:hypothetical protein